MSLVRDDDTPGYVAAVLVIVVLAFAAAAFGAEPIAAVLRLGAFARSVDAIAFDVRVRREEGQRTLRVEFWELAEVPWSPTFPFEGSIEQPPAGDLTRWEPRERYRAVEEELNEPHRRTWRIDLRQALPANVYEIRPDVVYAKGIVKHGQPFRLRVF